ncbi:MAG TPA: tonB-system energizer ExbB [Pseudorhizobium sp.]|jgi:biopolymer transport protein ExbB|nr:tonB-system energizer ExbB [Pseudorhizobium sp.]
MPSTAASIHYSRTCAHLGLAAIVIGLLTATPSMVKAQEPLPAQQSAPPAETVAPTVPLAPGATPQAATPAETAPDSETPATDTAPPAASPPLNPAAPEGTMPAEDAAPSTVPSAENLPAVDDPAADVPAMLQNLLPGGERRDIPHDLSPWGMFMAADWVVKGVMLGLAFASLVTWTVWLAKTLELAGARARAGRTLKIIRTSATLAEAVGESGQRGGPAAGMLRSAAEEVRLSEAALDHADNAGVKERVSSALARIESAAGRRMSRGTGVLATIGSTAPFVGLFGTVWGIMNAFIGISEAQTTNLAVVAPGIAEALLATAIGLVAAIPAVVIYNVFARSITGYRQLLADAAAGVERLVSRDLDFRKVPPGGRKAPVSLVAGE